VDGSSDATPGRWAERRAARAAKRAARAGEELVTAAVLPTEAEARLAAGSLEGQGIPAAVQLDQPVFASSWAEAARVIVRRRDLDRARQLLEGDEPPGGG
jgi:hypothetical protein